MQTGLSGSYTCTPAKTLSITTFLDASVYNSARQIDSDTYLDIGGYTTPYADMLFKVDALNEQPVSLHFNVIHSCKLYLWC